MANDLIVKQVTPNFLVFAWTELPIPLFLKAGWFFSVSPYPLLILAPWLPDSIISTSFAFFGPFLSPLLPLSASCLASLLSLTFLFCQHSQALPHREPPLDNMLSFRV